MTTPSWYPEWARQFSEFYHSRATSTFILHGNTHDQIPGKDKFVPLTQFLVEEIFGKWDIVFYYDLSTGIRVMGGSNLERQRQMQSVVARTFGPIDRISRDPAVVMAWLDQVVNKTLMMDGERLSIAFIFGHASFLVRHGDRSARTSSHVVNFLNWAASPYIKRLNLSFVLIDTALAEISDRIVQNPHITSIRIPLPKESERLRFLSAIDDGRLEEHSDYAPGVLARLTAGMGLTDLQVLVQKTRPDRRLDAKRFGALKKMLIERQAVGMLEFVESPWGLDAVVGHEAAKKRIREDAALISQGHLSSVPMGYLLCGPVGTGKSFFATCSAKTFGIPCVKLKNFRGGLVGETERNLERVLEVLRSMGPVVVIVDEADTQLGNRRSTGDSGVSGRVFGMIAQQMGDTAYRGKILWMLLTARPDLLPIDLKRQGRAEVHIPLFYPNSSSELDDMLVAMSRKLGVKIQSSGSFFTSEHVRKLSGADIEGVLGRAWRASLIEGETVISDRAFRAALKDFRPSHQGEERKLQILAATLESTSKSFLPEGVFPRSTQAEFNALKAKLAI